MANPQRIKVFVVERHGLPEDSVSFPALCGVQSPPLNLCRIGLLSGVCYSDRHRESLCASGLRSPELIAQVRRRTLVHRVNQLTWTLSLRAPAETVEYASRTVENGGRERLWSGCEPKPVSADQIHSTHGAQSPRAHETASSIVCGSWVDTAAGLSTRNRATMEKSSLLL